MKSYLETKDDKISYCRALLKMAYADKKVNSRELGFIQAALESNGISTEEYAQARLLFTEKGIEGCTFSGVEPAVQACVDGVHLMVSDLDMDIRELLKVMELARKFGIFGEKEVYHLLAEYAHTYIDSFKKLEGLYAKVFEMPAKIALNDVLPEKMDKVSYVLTLIKVADADGERLKEEAERIERMAKVFDIPDNYVTEAWDTYNANHDVPIGFTNKISAGMAIREAIQMSAIDYDCSDSEKSCILEIAKKCDVEMDKELLAKIFEAVLDKENCNFLKEQCITKWIELYGEKDNA